MRTDIASPTLLRPNFSVAFTNGFDHERLADIHVCDTFVAVRHDSQIHYFLKL